MSFSSYVILRNIFTEKKNLTDTVRMTGTAEKWHLSNLSNTPQNFCPMMVLTIGHKKG